MPGNRLMPGNRWSLEQTHSRHRSVRAILKASAHPIAESTAPSSGSPRACRDHLSLSLSGLGEGTQPRPMMPLPSASELFHPKTDKSLDSNRLTVKPDPVPPLLPSYGTTKSPPGKHNPSICKADCKSRPRIPGSQSGAEQVRGSSTTGTSSQGSRRRGLKAHGTPTSNATPPLAAVRGDLRTNHSRQFPAPIRHSTLIPPSPQTGT